LPNKLIDVIKSELKSDDLINDVNEEFYTEQNEQNNDRSMTSM